MATEKDKLFVHLNSLGEQAVRENLAQKKYDQKKIPLIEEWLHQLEVSRSTGTLERHEGREEEANALAREANNIARSALETARRSNRIASRAKIIAIIAAMIAAVSIAKDIIIAIFK